MRTIYNVYDQVAGLIALLEPQKIAALRASDEMQSRFDFLVNKLKSTQLEATEKDELDHFVVMERLFRLAKIKADAQRLSQ